MQLLLDDESGSRSPLHISSKDDSFEFDEESMVKLATRFSMDEDEQLRQYRKSLNEELATNVNAKFADQETIKETNSRSIKLADINLILKLKNDTIGGSIHSKPFVLIVAYIITSCTLIQFNLKMNT